MIMNPRPLPALSLFLSLPGSLVPLLPVSPTLHSHSAPFPLPSPPSFTISCRSVPGALKIGSLKVTFASTGRNVEIYDQEGKYLRTCRGRHTDRKGREGGEELEQWKYYEHDIDFGDVRLRRSSVVSKINSSSSGSTNASTAPPNNVSKIATIKVLSVPKGADGIVTDLTCDVTHSDHAVAGTAASHTEHHHQQHAPSLPSSLPSPPPSSPSPSSPDRIAALESIVFSHNSVITSLAKEVREMRSLLNNEYNVKRGGGAAGDEADDPRGAQGVDNETALTLDETRPPSTSNELNISLNISSETSASKLTPPEPLPLPHLIFVYGTLKTSLTNNLRYLPPTSPHCTFLSLASTSEKMCLTIGPHGVPYLHSKPELSFIPGEVYAVSDSKIEELDDLEGVSIKGDWYEKRVISVTLNADQKRKIEVIAYLCEGGRGKENMEMVVGDYTKEIHDEMYVRREDR